MIVKRGWIGEGVQVEGRLRAEILPVVVQIIWCSICKDDILWTGGLRILWQLNVPRCKIVTFVDEIVWNRILRIKKFVPPACLERRWKEEAMKSPPPDGGRSNASTNEYIRRKRKEFWNRKSPTGNWWDQLFDPEYPEHTSAIIRHPIPIDWVLEKRNW